MPELPEIETIKNDLTPHLTGKIVTDVSFPADLKIRILRRFPSQDEFVATLRGARIQALSRRGKYLLFHLEPPMTLIIHLGMSGQLLLRKPLSPPEPFLRVVFHCSPDTELRFIDPRKFGELLLQRPFPHVCPLDLDRLGPEPLGKKFTAAYLAQILRQSKRPIKTLLLDQRMIAGIGNIYSDEALFKAKIHPLRLSCSLKADAIRLLHQAIRTILRSAIVNRGTTASDQRYQDGLGRRGKFQTKLNVYQRKGKPCSVCGTPIETARIGGRTASFCPRCQC